MKVIGHLDPVVLEGELLRRIDAVQDEEGKTAPVLVVVPTRRLAEHVQRRLGARGGALLGVEVRHFRDLAGEIRRLSGEPAPTTASSRILAELLRLCVRDLPAGNRLRKYLQENRGAVNALLVSMNDLREARVEPDLLMEIAARERAGVDLARLYELYHSRLTGSATLLDESEYMGQTVEILAGRPEIRARYASVFLYGAYELVGTHLNLLRGLEPVTVLAPIDPDGGAPACRYAREYAKLFLLPADGGIEPVASMKEYSLAGDRLTALYEEEARPEPLPADRIFLRDFQGAQSEATWAVRQAMAGGGDPKETCILARDLSLYGPHLEEAFRKVESELDGEPVWTGSLRSPLRREPVVHDAMVVLQALTNDFPRALTVELLSSPRMMWNEILREDEAAPRQPDGARAEQWSRSAGILEGLDSWQNRLPSEAGYVNKARIETEQEVKEAEQNATVDQEEARYMVRLLETMKKSFKKQEPSTWSEHSSLYRKLLKILPVHPELDKLLTEMERLEQTRPPGDKGVVTRQEAFTWLESAVNESSILHRAGDNGGIRVLDAMQARGVTFQNLILLGFHTGAFPRIPREDPFLGNRLRRAIFRESGVPIPGWAEQEEGEEHLLLALMLGSAKGSIRISWQRADEAGRAVSPSAALREIARIVLGHPDASGMLQNDVAATPVPPREKLKEMGEVTGMLDPGEAGVFAALSSNLVTQENWRAGCEALGLSRSVSEMLVATERFAPGDMTWDGRIGEGYIPPDKVWSATGLENLGQCPLRFFFQKVLKVRELDEELAPLEIATKDMGTAVHKLLELAYGRLEEEGLLCSGDPEALAKRARELIDESWGAAFAKLRRQVNKPLLPLWNIRTNVWREAINQFLTRDLEKIGAQRPERIEFEKFHTREIDLGEGHKLHLGGKFDRLLFLPSVEGEEGERLLVGDYKTSGNLKDKTNLTYMLKGRQLQVMVYHLIPPSEPDVQLLGVGGKYLDQKDAERRPSFHGFAGEDQQEGMMETLRVLADLLERGAFPMHEDHHCSYCAFTPGCRAKHPPTIAREVAADDSRDYRLLGSKSKPKKLLLADIVRAEEAKP